MINLLTPPIFDDEDKNLAANQLFIIVWTFMAVGLLALFIAVIIPVTLYRWLLLIGFVELSGLILLALNKYGHVRLVNNLLIFSLWVAATAMALTGGGIESNAVAIYFIIVLIAGFVQSSGAGITTAVLCSLTGLFLVYLEYNGVLPANQVPHTHFTLWIANSIYMAIIIILQYLVSRTIKKALQQSRQEAKERQRVTAALLESEEKFRLLVENSHDIIYSLDAKGMFIFVSPAWTTLLGHPLDHVVGKLFQQFVHPDDISGCMTFLQSVIETGQRKEGAEYRVQHIDGKWYWHTSSAVPLEDEAGTIVGIYGIARDITERRQSEDALRQAHLRLDEIIEFLPDATFVIDANGKVIVWNRAMEKMTGVLKEEMIGKDNYEYAIPFYGDRRSILIDLALLPDEDFERNHYKDAYRQGDTLNAEAYAPQTCRGQGAYLSGTSTKLRDAYGNIIGAIESIRDVSDRNQAEEEKRSLEERLNRAEKMEALGQLAGGVAHDLNNVLGILSGYSELLLMEIPEGSRSRGHVEKILQSTEKGAAIIQDLLTLARRGVTVSDVINLNDVISIFFKTPVFENLKNYHPRVIFQIECDKNLLNIKGSSVHLEKTLMNLVSNAAESISGKGEVTIRTESRYLDKTIRGYDEVKEGDYAVLTVSDTGMGIPAEHREKIFEPFYTKKTMGRSGTGLGLAIVWGTVKDHNGYIDVQTKVGEGTTFTLYFPVTREELIAPQQKVPIEQYMGNGESVLVVDDIAEQREVASGLLRQLGYKVQAVSSGEEAVEYLKGNGVDILILDMIMTPGIDGLETYQRVLEINPQQKAILVSGFSETDRVREAHQLGAGAYVKKPYVMEKIGMAIRDELRR